MCVCVRVRTDTVAVIRRPAADGRPSLTGWGRWLRGPAVLARLRPLVGWADAGTGPVMAPRATPGPCRLVVVQSTEHFRHVYTYG